MLTNTKFIWRPIAHNTTMYSVIPQSTYSYPIIPEVNAKKSTAKAWAQSSDGVYGCFSLKSY